MLNMTIKIDTKDRKIIRNLEFNARMPIPQLAKRVGISRQVAEYRLRRLKENKVISFTASVFDQKVAGINIFRVILRLSKITKEKREEFINYVRINYPLMWLAKLGNGWDLIMNFMAKDSYEFDNMLMKITDNYGEYINNYIILTYINIYDMSRSYILPGAIKQNEERYFFHEMGDRQIKLDEIDREIAKILSLDCTVSDIAIGQKLGITGNTVKNRIKRMIDEKFLLGHRVLINPASIGYNLDIVFLEINNLQSKTEKELYTYLKSQPNITFIVKHIGIFRIGFEIETKDAKELDTIISDLRNRFSHIINNLEVFPVLEEFELKYI